MLLSVHVQYEQTTGAVFPLDYATESLSHK